MKKCIIVSEKPWNKELVARLNEKENGAAFIAITSKNNFSLETISAYNPDFIFFPHWSYMIPSEIYETFNCIVFHMTDLPFGRGGSPLQNLIVRGYKQTKLSAIKVVKELDAGPVFMKSDLSLEGTAFQIFERTDKLIEEMIQKIVSDSPSPIAQKGEVVTFKRRKPSDGKMNELKTLAELYDYIRMLDAPTYPSAFIEIGEFKLEFNNANLANKNILKANVRITKK